MSSPRCRAGPERDEKEKQIREEVARLKEKALAAGGLCIIGTERHESRRIDNQLRGRSGRQGDPGQSQLLPVAAGRPDAHLHGRAHGRDAAEARPQGGRGDHPSLDQPRAREGAAEGRGAQLRHPQEPPQVRRRDERPAQRHLRAAHRADGPGDGHRDRRRHAPRGRSATSSPSTSRRRPIPSSGTSTGLHEAVRQTLNLDLPVEDWAKEEGIADDEVRERLTQRRRRDGRAARGALRPRHHAPGREGGAAADARPSLARASRHPRPPPPGDRLPRLRPARPAQRVQDRGLRAVPGDARPSPRGGDRRS